MAKMAELERMRPTGMQSIFSQNGVVEALWETFKITIFLRKIK